MKEEFLYQERQVWGGGIWGNHATEVEEEYLDELGDSWIQESKYESDYHRYTDDGGVSWVRKEEEEGYESRN